MITLGIESSCDDTSIAIVKNGTKILANVISSQIDVHRRFGGVVPEVASRKHLEAILPLLNLALKNSDVSINDIGQIAATAGPGLLGSLLVGLTTAKTLAWHLNLPLIPVNHIEAHLTGSFLAANIAPIYPYLGLIVSGGHSNLVIVKSIREFELIGRTLDDAPGELFDKIARKIGLGYPGGPAIQKASNLGDPNAYELPRPMLNRGYDFSFSGLKTAVIKLLDKNKNNINLSNLCASLQKAVADIFVKKTSQAVAQYKLKTLVIAGGVAANEPLRQAMQQMANSLNLKLFMPNLILCTDNAAMIASHGFFSAHLAPSDAMLVNAAANWEMGKPYIF